MSNKKSQAKNKPVNKSIQKKIKKTKKKQNNVIKKNNRSKKKTSKPLNRKIKKNMKIIPHTNMNVSNNLSISVIASTNKEKYVNNIFENYKRQKYEKKELIIILNDNKLDLEKYKQKAAEYNNVRVFHIDEKKDLSDCINFGAAQSSCDLIAKFDDDDYYGPYYLTEAVYAIEKFNAGVVGKSRFYAYFEDSRKIGIRRNGVENGYTGYIHGPTLVIKRKVFNKFKFKNMSHGADQHFLRDCKKNKIKIYSTTRKNFIYIRHKSLQHHTWKIKNSNFMRQFRIIRKTNDYIPYSKI
ncbi:glycosyltransferase [Brassicibacter mesophilus]|uniref:glycosyltransferase n=1 Tax=Brassicibacter mesophilus TaxID=745119 RepID=UPI003D1DA458